MATTYYFSRDTKVYAHVPLSAAATKSTYFELPVLDGFSFTQATNATEITLNQAQSTGGASLRAEPPRIIRRGFWRRTPLQELQVVSSFGGGGGAGGRTRAGRGAAAPPPPRCASWG